MPDLTLRRDTFLPDRTFGKITVDGGGYLCESVEPGRDHNRPSTKDRPGACIPAGRYLCRRVNSPSHGDVFEVTGVEGRLYIQIHAANWSRQLRGCIAPGITRAVIDDGNPDTADDRGVTSSKAALAKLMALQAGLDAFWLTVVDGEPELVRAA